jgi:diguanylate cyclase (GGDEF)-like protein
MIDVDYFKTFNDRYGHLVGDVILREVSKTIKENVRQIDLVGKYGGDEFSIVLSRTSKADAQIIAERILKSIHQKQIRAYDENLEITVSIGISIFPDDANSASQIIEKADQALYQAKTEGRSRVCTSTK